MEFIENDDQEGTRWAEPTEYVGGRIIFYYGETPLYEDRPGFHKQWFVELDDADFVWYSPSQAQTFALSVLELSAEADRRNRDTVV